MNEKLLHEEFARPLNLARKVAFLMRYYFHLRYT